MVGKKAGGNILRQVTVCGTLLVIGYLGLFCLLQAPALWYDLRPDPVRSLIAEVFGPINAAFPQRWVNLDRTHKFALITAPFYVIVVALISGPLIYLLRRLSRPGLLGENHRNALLRRVFGFTLVIMFVLLFVRGLLSSDIYNYAWYSRIWTQYGASPYTHAPAEFPPDPEGAIYWIGWPDEMLVYGPAWLMASSVSYKLGEALGGTFSIQLLILRLLVDGAHLLNALLVWKIAGLILAKEGDRSQKAGAPMRLRLVRPTRFSTRMARIRRLPSIRAVTESKKSNVGMQAAALLFYIWNPLVLIEFAGSGHNDAVMLFFVLLALWLHLKGWWRAAALAIGLGTLVKLPALLLLPGYLWLLLWEGARQARGNYALSHVTLLGAWRGVQALAIVALVWIALYAPFWEGPRTLQPLFSGPASRLYSHTLAADALWNLPEPIANAFSGSNDRVEFMESVREYLDANLRLWFMGLFGVVALIVTWRARAFGSLLTAWGWVMIAAIMTQGWFWPWYVTWAIVPAALAPSRRLRNTTLIFTVSALLLYIEEQILGQHFKLFLDWGGLLVMGPPLVYILFSWLLQGGERGKYWRQPQSFYPPFQARHRSPPLALE